MDLRLPAAPFLSSVVHMIVMLRCRPPGLLDELRLRPLDEAHPIVRVALAIHPFMRIPCFMGWHVIGFVLIFETITRKSALTADRKDTPQETAL